MSVNTMDFYQVSTVLNDIVEQSTGQKSIAPTTPNEWVAVASRVTANGFDPILNSITQVLGRTIFSNRPYARRFAGLQVDEQIWGAITRKIVIADKPFENDPRYELVDGQAIDHYTVNKPNVLQVNFYGASIYEKNVTIFKDQLENAFRSPDEFSRFLSALMQNVSDMVEKAHEEMARACIANFIGGKVSANNGVIHLLTEYNTLTGLTGSSALTSETVYRPENFKPFMQWVYSRIEDLSSRMTERSELYQVNLTGFPVMRHTPREDQRVYLFAPAKAQIDAMVLADAYHDNYLKLTDTEAVNFWQSIETPASIQVTPTYLQADGTLVTPEDPVTVNNIFGVIFDRDAMGYTVMSTWQGVTPLNVKGGYWNQFYHFTDRYWNDFTEKGVVLLLD